MQRGGGVDDSLTGSVSSEVVRHIRNNILGQSEEKGTIGVKKTKTVTDVLMRSVGIGKGATGQSGGERG